MRTIATFVADMIERGRTKEQIRSVSAASRWGDKMDEVIAECEKQIKQKKTKK